MLYTGGWEEEKRRGGVEEAGKKESPERGDSRNPNREPPPFIFVSIFAFTTLSRATMAGNTFLHDLYSNSSDWTIFLLPSCLLPRVQITGDFMATDDRQSYSGSIWGAKSVPLG